MRARLRDPFTWIVLGFSLFCAVGAAWNLPCTDAWSNDEVSPRASMLGAVFETWTPGHFFRYPPLHVLLLTVLQSPLILAGIARAGLSQAAIEHELISPSYMTPAAIVGRLVAFAMGLTIVWNQKRLWERIGSPRVGLVAAALTACNPVFVYFAHTASVDIPYLFWTSFALVEMDRVAQGEPRERHLALFTAAALLTKDQSAFLLFGPLLFVFVVQRMLAAEPGKRVLALWQPRLLRAGALGLGIFLVVSGMVTNPSGFRKKLEFMRWGNTEWVVYERSWHGLGEQLADIASSVPRYGTWLVAVAALVGLALAARSPERQRRLLPAVAALSYFALFVIPSRWTMERHLMPLSLFLLPYAGFLLERVADARVALATALAFLLPQIRDVASIDGTLLADSRDEATRFLDPLPAGTKVEIYGGNQYLPHLSSQLDVTRVGLEDFSARSSLPNVVEKKEPFGAIGARAPEYLVMQDVTVRFHAPLPGTRLSGQGRLEAADPDGKAFFEGLEAESGGYQRVLRAQCTLPWPLECRRIHLSTGAETWIYRRR